MEHVAKNIKLLRNQNNWNQSNVASKLNISIPAYSKIETGATVINLTRLAQIADLFEVSIHEILTKPGEAFDLSNLQRIEEAESKLVAKEHEVSVLQRKLIQLFEELRCLRGSF
jgi:transcriptional regulator with XRE-family HTH domain